MDMRYLQFVQPVQNFGVTDDNAAHSYMAKLLKPSSGHRVHITVDTTKEMRSTPELHRYLWYAPKTREWYQEFSRLGYVLTNVETLVLLPDEETEVERHG